MDIQTSVEAVKAAVAANNLDEAIRAANDAVRTGAQDPLVYNVAAHGLQVQRRYVEAMDLLIRGARLAPNDPFLMIGIGQVNSQMGRFAESEAAFRNALAIDPTLVAALHGLGLALEIRGDVAQSRRCFEEAARLAPDFPDPLGSLALQALQRKDEAEARTLAERTLRLDPRHTAASIVLANLDYQARDLASAERRARAVLESPDLPPLHESSVRRLLGDILDAAGRPLEAFEFYAGGNRLFRQTYQPQVVQSQLEEGVEFVTRLKVNFEALTQADWTAPAVARRSDEPAGHVIMTGFFRSGTTLLEQVLASHPQIETMEEITILDDVAWDFFKAPEGLGRLANIDSAQADRLRREYWARIRATGRDPGQGVFVDKLPMASIWSPFVAKVFPEAKILFVRRDPRDVVLSCFRHRFHPGALRSELADLDRAARLYAGVMDLFEAYRARLPLAVHVLRHEDLVEDFDRETQAMCAFIGVEWREEMRDFAETAKRRTIRTPSASQVVQGLNAQGVGRWRPYAPAMTEVLPILQPWVERFGYPAA